MLGMLDSKYLQLSTEYEERDFEGRHVSVDGTQRSEVLSLLLYVLDEEHRCRLSFGKPDDGGCHVYLK